MVYDRKDGAMNDKIWQWIGDYCSGSLDEVEGRELREWMDESEENRQYFMEGVKMVWQYRFAAHSDDKRNVSLARVRAKIHVQRRRSLWIKVSIAASVLILLASTLLFVNMSRPDDSDRVLPVLARVPAGSTKAMLELADGIQVDLMQDNLKEIMDQYGTTVVDDKEKGLRYDCLEDKEEEPVFHTITVPIGGEYHFTLADGSLVWLNSASQLTFPTKFTGDTREVTVKGEVYFEVQHDEYKPFIVRSGDMKIQVLGTKFCVSAYPEDSRMMTTLVQGAVKVECGGHDVVLEPGFQASVDKTTGEMKRNAVELSLYTSWVKGVFEYENMSLADIVVQLARWYDVTFEFSAPDKERRFTGMVRKYADLNDVLDMIEKTTNVKFIMNGRNVTITSLVR